MSQIVSIFSYPQLVFTSLIITIAAVFPFKVIAEAEPLSEPDIPAEILQESPVLQKWLEETPNVLEDIRRDPSFRTRLNIGFVIYPSNDETTGIQIAVKDIFIGRTGLTLSADYQTSFDSDRISSGADLHYFLLPLGSYVNIAPLLGYRYVQQDDFNTDGVNLGLRLMLSLSRTGGADISIAQSFVSPGSDQETGLFTVSLGYGITNQIRLSTDWKLQNSKQNKDDAFSLGIEYLF